MRHFNKKVISLDITASHFYLKTTIRMFYPTLKRVRVREKKRERLPSLALASYDEPKYRRLVCLELTMELFYGFSMELTDRCLSDLHISSGQGKDKAGRLRVIAFNNLVFFLFQFVNMSITVSSLDFA